MMLQDLLRPALPIWPGRAAGGSSGTGRLPAKGAEHLPAAGEKYNSGVSFWPLAPMRRLRAAR
ncbi:hypothetical protein RA20_00160 [Leisingera sp. ANG-Vp]|nr:hypothetical protein RA20_00160 [Leisingera sp. ANG-Vp]